MHFDDRHEEGNDHRSVYQCADNYGLVRHQGGEANSVQHAHEIHCETCPENSEPPAFCLYLLGRLRWLCGVIRHHYCSLLPIIYRAAPLPSRLTGGASAASEEPKAMSESAARA